MQIAGSTTIGHRKELGAALDRLKALGFTSADLLMAHGWAHVSPRELVDDFAGTRDRIADAFSSRAMTISSLNVAFSGPLYGRTPDDVARRNEECTAVVRLLSELDVAVAAVQPGGRPHGIADNTLIADASRSWREVTEIADRGGRRVALELHTGSPFDSPDAARELVRLVPQTVFAFDPSHIVGEGINLKLVGWIIERSAHVQLRDARSGRVQVPFGEGEVDFEWIVGVLERAGYDGYLAVEYLETGEFDAEASSKALREHLLGFVR